MSAKRQKPASKFMPAKSRADFSPEELESFKRNAEALKGESRIEGESHAYNWRSRQNLKQNRER